MIRISAPALIYFMHMKHPALIQAPGAYSGIYGNWKNCSGHTLKVPSLYQLELSFSIDKSSQLQKVRVYLYHPLQN